MESKQMRSYLILNKAADLLENVGWTKGASARNEEGYPINFGSEKATCFCLIGAILKAKLMLLGYKFEDEDDKWDQSKLNALNQVSNQLGIETGLIPLAEWNDSQQSKKEVVQVLRDAANKGKQQ